MRWLMSSKGMPRYFFHLGTPRGLECNDTAGIMLAAQQIVRLTSIKGREIQPHALDAQLDDRFVRRGKRSQSRIRYRSFRVFQKVVRQRKWRLLQHDLLIQNAIAGYSIRPERMTRLHR
jgi:hypothetical protein